MAKKKAEVTVINTEPLKRFLNKQQNLKTVRLIHDLDELQSRLELGRTNPELDIKIPIIENLPKSVMDKFRNKLRDQYIMIVIDEIDSLFLTLKENL